MKGRTGLQIRRYGRSFAVLLLTALIGTAAGFYILLQQRLPNPFQNLYHVDGAFPTAAAVAPGLGEPVNVAGVRVGQITGVELVSGQGIVHMAIDPAKLPHLYAGAHADLVPNTPLKDMEVDIHPGDPRRGALATEAARRITIPASETTSPTDADELLLALDADTRQWFTSLITDLDLATRGRGADIRRLFTTLGPTAGQLRAIGDLLAARRRALSNIVSNLGVVTRAAGAKDAQLRKMVRAANTVLGALAGQDVALRAAITRLPGTLRSSRTALADLTPFANALGPAARALLPTARHLPGTLRDANTLFGAAALLPVGRIRPFVAAVGPLGTQLGPLNGRLGQAVPALTKAFKVLHYVTNEVAYVPGGANRGFLYWTAWFAHNLDSFISTGDANGPAWRGVLIVNCASLKGSPAAAVFGVILGTNFGCKGAG